MQPDPSTETIKESAVREDLLAPRAEKSEKRTARSQSFSAFVWRRFRKNRVSLFALGVLAFLVLVALFHPLIVGTKPVVTKYKGSYYFPVMWYYSPSGQWENYVFSQDKFRSVYPTNLKKNDPDSWAIWPLVYQDPYRRVRDREWQGLDDERWKDRTSNENNGPPTRYSIFGTDEFGRDVFARLVHGTPIALLVGFVSMGIATIIGLTLGSMSGYYGDERMRLTLPTLVVAILAVLLLALRWSGGPAPEAPPGAAPAGAAAVLEPEQPAPEASEAAAPALASTAAPRSGSFLRELLILFAALFAVCLTQVTSRTLGEQIPLLGREIVRVPVDVLLTRLMDVVLSIPTLILILALIAIIPKPTIWHTMAIIGATSWVGIARLVRGEFLKLKNMEFTVAAEALGASDARIMFRHILPNALAPVLVSISFGVAGAILIESGLSFLGFGVQPPTPSWGSVLRDGFKDLSQWWMIIFPGMAVFIAVFTYNLVGDGLQEAMDPRLKR
jgi:peptide/nickel transport system permease protein